MILTTATTPSPIVIAHRGNSGNPLNSINIEDTKESIKSAWTVGADAVELDVHLTKDGVLVVHHDDNLGRVFIIPGDDCERLISDYTWAELQRAEVNRLKLEKQISRPISDSQIKIPRLEDLLPIPDGKKLFIELKFPDNKMPSDTRYLKKLIRKVVAFINENKLLDKVIVISFVGESLDKVKNLNPKIVTGLDTSWGESKSESKIRRLKEAYGFNCLLPKASQTKEYTVTFCRGLGLDIYPWISRENPFQELRKLTRLIESEREVNGVITNQPGMFKRILDEHFQGA